MDAILRIKDVIAITGLSKSTIDAKTSKLSPYFDPEFPQKFKLGNDRAIGWSRAAVEAWVNKRSSNPDQLTSTSLASLAPKKKRAKQEAAIPPTSKPKRKPARKTLAEAIVHGSDLVAHITQFTELASWTPAMGCMLAAGVAPEINVQDIPLSLGGKDLNDNELGPLDSKLMLARRLLYQWNMWAEDEEPIPLELSPSKFLYWCWDNNIDTPWLQLIRQLGGSNDAQSESISNAQMAILMRR